MKLLKEEFETEIKVTIPSFDLIYKISQGKDYGDDYAFASYDYQIVLPQNEQEAIDTTIKEAIVDQLAKQLKVNKVRIVSPDKWEKGIPVHLEANR